MSFCTFYNKTMKKLNEFEHPVSEINIFTGIVNIIDHSFWHVLIWVFCLAIVLVGKLFTPLMRLLTFFENRTHINKRFISPIYVWLEQIKEDISWFISDLVYELTTSKCEK